MYLLYVNQMGESPNTKHKLQLVRTILINISYEVCVKNKRCRRRVLDVLYLMREWNAGEEVDGIKINMNWWHGAQKKNRYVPLTEKLKYIMRKVFITICNRMMFN